VHHAIADEPVVTLGIDVGDRVRTVAQVSTDQFGWQFTGDRNKPLTILGGTSGAIRPLFPPRNRPAAAFAFSAAYPAENVQFCRRERLNAQRSSALVREMPQNGHELHTEPTRVADELGPWTNISSWLAMA